MVAAWMNTEVLPDDDCVVHPTLQTLAKHG